MQMPILNSGHIAKFMSSNIVSLPNMVGLLFPVYAKEAEHGKRTQGYEKR